MSIQVELPDGSKLEVDDNATLEDVAYEIGTGLGDDTQLLERSTANWLQKKNKSLMVMK